jgi:nucleotide-binding universal stress UspA family protein
MFVKSILVPVDGRRSNEYVVHGALSLAQKLQAQLSLLHIESDPKQAVLLLGEGISGVLIDDMIARADEENAEFRSQAQAEYQEVLAQFDPAYLDPKPRFINKQGREDIVIAKTGQLTDLLVVAKPSDENRFFTYQCLQSALFETGRPVLMWPDKKLSADFKKIAICWNGSLEGAKAVIGALGFLQKAEQIDVLCANTDKSSDVQTDDLMDYLGLHGISAKRIDFDPKPFGSVGLGLLEKTSDMDLMVMGAYSHSRMRELILGGVTRDILEESNIPVLMSH